MEDLEISKELIANSHNKEVDNIVVEEYKIQPDNLIENTLEEFEKKDDCKSRKSIVDNFIEENLKDDKKEIEQEESISSEESDAKGRDSPTIKLNKYNQIYIKEYDLFCDDESYKKIDFLKDYSIDLLNLQCFDPKIINWTIENRKLLFEFGVDEKTLVWMIKQDKYYKTENVLNNMTYRLSKFGKLATNNEIVRKLNKDDNEDNFKYYEDDSFLVNEEEESDTNDFCYLFSKRTFPGIFTEEKIIQLIKKHKKSKESKIKVKKNKGNNLLGKKRKASVENSSAVEESQIYNTIDELISKNKSKRDNITSNPRNKFGIIKELIAFYKRKKNENIKLEDEDFKKICEFIDEEHNKVYVIFYLRILLNLKELKQKKSLFGMEFTNMLTKY